MAMRLANELKLYGCETSEEDFVDTLTEIMQALYPGWGSAELEKHPSCGVLFCQAVRGRVRCEGLPEEMIMRRLSNVRKTGKESLA